MTYLGGAYRSVLWQPHRGVPTDPADGRALPLPHGPAGRPGGHPPPLLPPGAGHQDEELLREAGSHPSGGLRQRWDDNTFFEVPVLLNHQNV